MRLCKALDQALSLGRPVVQAAVHQHWLCFFALKNQNSLLQDAEGVRDPRNHLVWDGLQNALIEIPVERLQPLVDVNVRQHWGTDGFKVDRISLTDLPVYRRVVGDRSCQPGKVKPLHVVVVYLPRPADSSLAPALSNNFLGLLSPLWKTAVAGPSHLPCT